MKKKTEKQFEQAFNMMDEVLAHLQNSGNEEQRNKLYEAMKLLKVRPA